MQSLWRHKKSQLIAAWNFQHLFKMQPYRKGHCCSASLRLEVSLALHSSMKFSSDLQHWSDTGQTKWCRTLPLYLRYVWWTRRTYGAWKIGSHRNDYCHLLPLLFSSFLSCLTTLVTENFFRHWAEEMSMYCANKHRNILIEDSFCSWYDSYNEIENTCLRYLSQHTISTRTPKSQHIFLLASNKKQWAFIYT